MNISNIICAATLLAGGPHLALASEVPASDRFDPAQRLAAEVRDRGWICYASRSDSGDWDLFLCRPDGSLRRNLTTTPDRNEFAPQFSRDGRKLLYRRLSRAESIDGNRYGEQGELVIAKSDGSEPKTLGQPGEFPWATWSADGRQIACLSLKGISLIDLANRQVARKLERKGFFQQIGCSPDGRWLVGVANSFGTGWSIARLDLASGEAAAIHRVDCCTPDWFPDSQNLVFSWRPPGQSGNGGQGWTQLWRADVGGQSAQLIFGEDGRHVYGGHVSPDGRFVLFTGNVEEDGDPQHAGAPMGLIRLSDAPVISGESKALRKLHPEAKNGPVLALPAGWEPCWTFSEITGNTGGSSAPAASPEVAALAGELHNQGWLAFSARTDAEDWDLFLMRPDGSGRRRLTDTREFNEAGVRFSPDGKRLLYYRMPKSEAVDNNSYGTFDLVIAKSDGTDPEVYGKELPWASWGPDSRQIACLTPKGIQVVELSTRKVVQQFPRRGLVQQLVWSPDGKRFVGTANGLGQFWNIGVLNPAVNELRAVSETDRYNCTPDWCPDSEQVVYARGIIPNVPGRAELWVASANGQVRRPLYAEAGHHIYGACASPDGKYVMFTRSMEDLGKVQEIEMAIIHWPEASHPVGAPDVVRLDLGPGWEPHWTAKEIVK
jgi:Tol biopolymer transport system component